MGTDMVRVAEGREAEVFERPDGMLVKLLRDAGGTARVDREAAALRVLAQADLPAPRVHGLVEIDGRPGLVIDRLAGSDLLAQIERNPLRVEQVASAMARAHASLHEVEAPASLPDLRSELGRQITHAPGLPDDLRHATLAVLGSLPAGDRLCHGDFHPGNMIGDLGSAPGVIDWADASRGDPTGDVARTVVLLRIGKPPPGASRVLRVLTSVGGSLLAARYLARYRKLRDVDATHLARWQLVRAAARVAEPIPEEHPALLALVRRELAKVG